MFKGITKKMNRNIDKRKILNRIFFSIFFIFFLIYISTLQYRPYPFSYLVKIIPILALSQIVFRNIQGNKGKWILAGLLFSALGDVFLSISGKGYFLYGLGSFAIAHVMYISAFLRNVYLFRMRSFLVLPFIIYGIVFGYFLFPHVGARLIPVAIYFCLILLMAFSTILGKDNSPVLILGAFLFLLSDSVIAVNMYLSKVPNSSFWIMITYFSAQFLLTYGSMKREKTGGTAE
jgi:alkenylglycerophosphocholine hydrolase